MTSFDDRMCTLGEGPLWHPERGQLFWFDILKHRLLTRTDGKPSHWQFNEPVSAAGWVDQDTLLIASASALFRFNLSTSESTHVCDLEADTPANRSNDGRADRQGGFWIGTMAMDAAHGAGAIYRFFKGELRCLFPGISIPNAICFSPDGRTAYFTDTPTGIVRCVALDADGWPEGPAETFIDMSNSAAGPDGAVTDAAGNLWLAEWGGARISCYSPKGDWIAEVPASAEQVTCPAFGGPDYRTLFWTSAAEGLSHDALSTQPLAGQTFSTQVVAPGLQEPRIQL